MTMTTKTVVSADSLLNAITATQAQGNAAEAQGDIAEAQGISALDASNQALAAAGITAGYISETTSDPTTDGAVNDVTKGAKRNADGSWQRLLFTGGAWTAEGSPLMSRESMNYVNVKWFGATGDGLTNDTTAIQNAYNSVVSSGGGVLYFPKGEYLITSQIIVISSNLKFQGDGRNQTILKGLSVGQYFKLGNSGQPDVKNIVFEDIGFIHNNKYAIFIGDTAADIQNIHITRCGFVGDATGIVPIVWSLSTGANRNLYIRDCFIENGGGAEAYGILITSIVNGVWIQNNEINLTNANNLLPADTGAYNNIAIYGDCKNFHVTNNICRGGGHSPIAISPAGQGEIIGNQVFDCKTTDEAGIEVEFKSGHSGSLTSFDVIIANNIVQNCYWGVLITDRDATTNQPYNVIVTGNVVKNTDHVGIYLRAGENVIITDNVVIDSVLTGIRVGTKSNKVTIRGNEIINSAQAIWVTDITSGFGENILVSSNVIKNVTGSNGIQLTGTSWSLIVDNIIDTVANVSGVGAAINLTSGATVKTQVSRNVIRDAAGRGIYLGDSAQDNIVSENIIEAVGTGIDDLGLNNDKLNNKII